MDLPGWIKMKPACQHALGEDLLFQMARPRMGTDGVFTLLLWPDGSFILTARRQNIKGGKSSSARVAEGQIAEGSVQLSFVAHSMTPFSVTKRIVHILKEM